MNKDKIRRLKQEFRSYLIKTLKVSDVTVRTYLGDAFYVFRHQCEFREDFFSLFAKRQFIDDFRNELLKQQRDKNIKNPKGSTSAYINGLYKLYDFFQYEYDGVENFINS